MMSRFFILSVLVLLLCSAFAEEASHQHDQTKATGVEVGNAGVEDMKQGGGGGSRCGRYGCCRYGRYGCVRCCRNAEEATAFANEVEVESTDKSGMGVEDMKQGGGGGSRCGRYGCCRYGRYGCVRCCRNAEEATAFANEMEVESTDKSGMGVEDMKQGGGGGSRCGRYGCCRYGRYGCVRCCRNAEEAKAFANEVEVESTDKSGMGVEDMKQGGGGGSRCGRYGCCRYGRYGCVRCCRNAEEATAFANEVEVESTDTSGMGVEDMKQGGGGGSRCGRYGCCRYGRYGCVRCCRNAEEAKAFANEVEVESTEKSGMGVEDMKQGGGGGSRCGRYGCCRYGRYGCVRCCRNAEEAKAFATEAETVKNTDKSEIEANEAETVMNTDKSNTEGYGGDKGYGEGQGHAGGGGKGYGGVQDHGGGGGGGCGKYGCCKYGNYGCQRCCHSAEEAKNSSENQAKQETKN